MFGATGFIGSHLVDALVARGERVVAACRPTPDRHRFDRRPVEVRLCDIVTGEGLQEAVAGATAIYALAGATRSCTPEELWQVNRVGGEQLAQAARGVPGLRRFVQVTTSIAAGPSAGRPWTEDDPSGPIDPYGESKLALEQELRKMDDLPWVILRPSAVYGPRDVSLLPVFELPEAYGMFFQVGDGTRRVSMVHVDDVVRACLIAAEHPAAVHQVFYVTGEEADWKELAGIAGRALGRRLRRIRMPTGVLQGLGELLEWRYRITGLKHSLNRRKAEELVAEGWTVSGEKAERVLGFRPAVRLEEGFAETVRWWRYHDLLPDRLPRRRYARLAPDGST